MKFRPVLFQWDGSEMIPLPRFMPICDRQFVIGEQYPLAIVENRSMKSHSHYFAALHDAWLNLPEDVEKLRARWPTIRTQSEEHLRKWALVEVGYAVEEVYVYDTPKDARLSASAMRRRDDFAIILVRGNVVKVFTPKSQSVPAMKKEEFQDSKKKVLDLLDDVTGVPRGTLAANAGRSA